MNIKKIGIGLIVFAIIFSMSGCATILNNKQTTVSSVTGSKNEVTILENGSVVYQGTLPAIINVNGSNSYTVQFKDKDGSSRTMQLQKRMSGWFIADVLLLGGWVIDLITGNVMQYNKAVNLPISYSTTEQILLTDFVPADHIDDFTVRGNIYHSN